MVLAEGGFGSNFKSQGYAGFSPFTKVPFWAPIFEPQPGDWETTPERQTKPPIRLQINQLVKLTMGSTRASLSKLPFVSGIRIHANTAFWLPYQGHLG